MKVLVTDPISQPGIEILKSGGLIVDMKPKLTPEQLLREIGEYDGLIIRSGTQVTAAVIDAAAKLKVIGRAGSGLDNVDLAAATKRGIAVMNTPGGNTTTTAELTIAMIASMTRLIPQATASVKAGKWEKGRFMGMELYNKTLGIVGVGQIGSYVTKMAQGWMMSVIGYDPYLLPENAAKMGVELVGLPELYRRADIISIHVPLTSETKALINADAIRQMKDGVRIVNCARGGIVDEAALYEGLKSGKIAGAACDVFEKEPVDPKNPLLSLENFICTPHIGAATVEAQENVALAVAEQVVDFLVKGIVRNAVNIPSVSAELLPKVQPYLVLAEKLGLFQAQRYEGALESVVIEYQGEVTALSTAPITIAALKGLLTPILEETVNYVNASIIAKERGIEVKEVKSNDAGDFASRVLLRVKSGNREGTVAGILYNRKEPRIVEIDSFEMEVVPEGYMLMLTNNDQPGVIGNLGTLLGNHQINISRLQLGREKAGGRAISMFGIDAAVSQDLLAKIKKLPNILSVRQIKL